MAAVDGDSLLAHRHRQQQLPPEAIMQFVTFKCQCVNKEGGRERRRRRGEERKEQRNVQVNGNRGKCDECECECVER